MDGQGRVVLGRQYQVRRPNAPNRLARFRASYASQLEDVNPAELGTASQRPSFDAPGGRGADG